MRRLVPPALLSAVLLAACGGSSNPSTRTVTQIRTSSVRGPAPATKPIGEAAHAEAASGCGIERWAVKTGTDPGARAVSLTPKDTTVATLAAIPAPANPTDRLSGVETTTWRLTATVYAIKQEADSDYHLAIRDAVGNTMIAESPSTSCDAGSLFAPQIASVRSAIDQACPGIGGTYQDVSIPATLTGVGFFDRIHGQRGVAPNGVELHPLLSIALNGHC